MTDMKYLADALAYHTKGRKAVLEQTEIQEKKCSCCDADPCSCGDDCGCKKDVKEAALRPSFAKKLSIDRVNKDKPAPKPGKTTGPDDYDFLKYKNKKKEEVKEGQDLKNDKNGNGVDDKDESEAKDNVVKKTNAKADKKVEEADKSSWMKDSGWKDKDGPTKDKFGNEIKDKNRAKSLAKDAAKTSAKMTKEEVEDELLEHALDLHEMIQDLNAMFIEEDLSLTEAFQAAAMTDEELEEGIQQMSKVKQAIARKKAGRRKKLTPGYKMNKPSIKK